MSAYYNEIDLYAAEWLRNLIKAGHIADGEVDTRSIVDVQPDDLKQFTQCHFFAGIAGWSHALRLAGWSDERKIWTGSCPCQPFSVAGQGKGTDDPRHLWPHFFRLIRGCRPPVVMGEQVAGAAGYGWLDGVRSDLESENYAIEGVDIPACSANAPHIRSRLYWVATDMADANNSDRWNVSRDKYGSEKFNGSCQRGVNINLDDANVEGCEGYDDTSIKTEGRQPRRGALLGDASSELLNMANANSGGCIKAGERGTLDTIHSRELHDRMPIAERDTCGNDMADASVSGWGQRVENAGRVFEGNRTEGEAGRFAKHGDAFDMADTENNRRQSIEIQRSSLEFAEGNFETKGGEQSGSNSASSLRRESSSRATISDMADSASEGLEGTARASLQGSCDGSSSNGAADNMADTATQRRQCQQSERPSSIQQVVAGKREVREQFGSLHSGVLRNYWHDAIWLNGADGKTRRAQPDICLLAHGVPARVGKLRAYGNAIVPQIAAEVIKAFMES